MNFNGLPVKCLRAPIVSNTPIARDTYELTFGWDPEADRPRPGQFLSLLISRTTVPLLRRPFAFAGFVEDEGIASVIFLLRGGGTAILANMTPGNELDIMGPLGNGFVEPRRAGQCILVAGGTGLGPVLYWARYLSEQGRQVLLVYGARGREQVPDHRVFAGLHAAICTDDGSTGFHGTTVEYLHSHVKEMSREAVLYCCGPTAMLRCCHELAVEREIPCHVSMEQTMACGVGACMGCAIKMKNGRAYARVCRDGPVFDSRDIAWT